MDQIPIQYIPMQPYQVYAISKTRFDDELIEYLLDLKWWDWSAEKIE